MQRPRELSGDLLRKIAEAIQSVQFGSVQITIHDSRVVQIEKAEKIRVRPSADLTTGGLSDPDSRANQTAGGCGMQE